MSAAFRGDKSKDAAAGLTDEPLEAQAEHPPGLKIAIGLMELVFGIFTNCVQVTTSTIAILSMIIGPVIASMSPGDVFGQFRWKALIALVIASAVQLFLHKNAQPMSSTWHRLRHIQHFNIKSTSARTDVENAITIGAFFFMVALLGDIISDATFVNLFTHNSYVIVGWMLFLTGSSTLLMYDGATRIWGALEDWKDYRAYHAKNDPH